MRMSKKRRTTLPEVDLHGLTLDEALAEVERELNHTFIQEGLERRLRFVTGCGAVLRSEVQKHLFSHPLVKELILSGSSVEVTLEDS